MIWEASINERLSGVRQLGTSGFMYVDWRIFVEVAIFFGSCWRRSRRFRGSDHTVT